MKKCLPLFLFLSATPVLAHDGAVHGSSLLDGFIHPLSGADHILAMIAVGLIATAFSGRRGAALPVAFLSAMVAGFATARMGVALPSVDAVVLMSVVVLGMLVLMPVRILPALVAVSGFALYHGHAHGLEAGRAETVSFALGFLAASAGLILSGIIAGHLIRDGRPGLLPTSD